MRHLFRIYTMLLTLVIFAAPLPGQDLESINSITICVDFNATGNVTLSNGTSVAVTPSGLDSAQKASVLAKIKSKYDPVLNKAWRRQAVVLGLSNVTVIEKPPGGCPAGSNQVVVSGSSNTRYGNAGKPPGPSVVFAGTFKRRGFTGDELACSIGETAAHEVGHRCGLSHNCDSNDLMCDGKKVSDARRKQDKRGFNKGDSTRIRAYNATTVEPNRGAFGVHIGDDQDADFLGECLTADAEVTFISPLPRPIELGFINVDGDFISSRSSDDEEPLLFTFLFPGTYDLAVMNQGALYSTEEHATIDLLDEGPGGEKIYRRAAIKFDFDKDNTPDVTVHLVLHDNDGSGFYIASESGVDNGTIASGASLEVNYRSGGATEPMARLSLAKREHVKLALYDALGAELATIADGEIEAGTHTFGIATAGLPSGVYYLRLQREGEAITRTITIVR